ncbi:MAG: M56 family metallopeptidase [Pseudomonadota bacterium]
MDWGFLTTHAAQTTIAVSALIVLVLLVRKPFAKRFGAKAAYALWLAPTIRLFLPPLPPGWGVFKAPSAASEPTTQLIVPAAEVAAPALAAPSGPVLTAPPPAPTPSAPAEVVQLAAEPSFNEPLLFAAVWFAGAALLLGRNLYRQWSFSRLIADDSDAPSDAILAETRAIERRLKLKKPVEVRTSLLCSGPLVTGVARPIILLPAWFETDYSPKERRDALTHELMHVRRRDLWALQIANVFLALQWFNPLAYLAMRTFRVDQEAACDADVLRKGASSPQAYGRTLLKAARLSRPSDGAYAAASLTLSHPIKERLIMMQTPLPNFSRRLVGGALSATVGAAALLASASSVVAQEDVRPDQEREHRHIHLSSDHGLGEDRHMVLLGDPFEALHPRFKALGEMDFSNFDMKFDFDFNVPNIDMSDLNISVDIDGAAIAAQIQAVNGLASGIVVNVLDDEDIATITLNGETFKLPRDEAAFEAAIESFVEDFEPQIEAWAENIEVRAEAWAEEYEAKAEAWSEEFEERFGDEFESEVDGAADVVKSLADQCGSRSLDTLDPEIVSATDAQSGEVYRALCLNGPKDRLQSEEVEGYVRANPELSEDEKDAFFQRVWRN